MKTINKAVIESDGDKAFYFLIFTDLPFFLFILLFQEFQNS